MLAEVARTSPAITVQASWADWDEPWALGRALLGEIAVADFTTVSAACSISSGPPWPPCCPIWCRALKPGHPASRQALVLEAAVRLATALDGPLLMVDDLQWADPTSLRLLAALHARVLGLRLLLTSGAGRGATRWLGGRVRPTDGGTDRLSELGPLTPSAIARLTRTPESAAALERHTDQRLSR